MTINPPSKSPNPDLSPSSLATKIPNKNREENNQMEALRENLGIASYILLLLSFLNCFLLLDSQFSAFTAGAFAGSAVTLAGLHVYFYHFPNPS